MLGFDECLGTATYEKFEETQAAAVSVQLPVAVTRGKRSSSRASSDPAEQYNGRVTIELTMRRKLDAL